MAFSLSSFFAGVGTVVAAMTIGFAGGTMITISPQVEPNRLERVAASKPGIIPAVAAKSETPTGASVTAAKAETAQTAAAPDRVISLTPASNSQQTVPSQLQPVMAKDDARSQIDNARKVRESELRREKAERRTESRRERRKHQEIQSAANAVRQIQRDGGFQEMSQRDDTQPQRFGFFGND
jgi:hypothetical protein